MRNLMHAARPLANDLFSSLLFAVLMALHVDPQTATLVAIGTGLAHVILWRLLGRPIAPMQFLMAKPSVIYLIVTAMMLKRGWMLRYLPPAAQGRAEGVTVAFGYVWAGLMFTTAAANLAVAILAPASWPVFLAVFPTVSKLALFGLQFATIRRLTIRRIRAEMAAA